MGKIQEQIHQVCEYLLANASQVDSPEVLAAARALMKTTMAGGRTEGRTVEELSDAIRGAKDLSDLKHLVGPSDEDSQLAVRRLEKIEVIWNRNEKAYGCNPDLWPFHEKEAYNRLMGEQRVFEAVYC